MVLLVFLIFTLINSTINIKLWNTRSKHYVDFTIPDYLSSFDCLVMQAKLIENICRDNKPFNDTIPEDKFILECYKSRLNEILGGYSPSMPGNTLSLQKLKEVKKAYITLLFELNYKSREGGVFIDSFESVLSQYQFLTPVETDLEKKGMNFKTCLRCFIQKNKIDLSTFGDFNEFLEREKREFYEVIRK